MKGTAGGDHLAVVRLLGPADAAPAGVELLRCAVPRGYPLLIILKLGDQVCCMASRTPDRALAAAHAALELAEARGQRPRIVFAPDGRRLVAAAARAVAREEEDGPHRRLVNEIRPRWDRVVAPSTRH